jgi:hypothetical protein
MMNFTKLSALIVVTVAALSTARAANHSISYYNHESTSTGADAPFVSTLVINEVYGGGGNTGAPFNQDFVELFNAGTTAVDISGFSLQYSSATGTTYAAIATFAAGTTIAPGTFFLVSSGPIGTTGSALPTPNVVGSTGVNLSATAGKVRLLDAALNIVDLVGYGATANQFEGSPAPAPSNTMSISRTGGIDTDNNAADFVVTIPTPVPEPATYVLLGVGLLACAQRFRRAKKQ